MRKEPRATSRRHRRLHDEGRLPGTVTRSGRGTRTREPDQEDPLEALHGPIDDPQPAASNGDGLRLVASGTEDTASKVLPDRPVRPDMRRIDRDRLPVRPAWWDDPWTNIKWATGYAAHVAAFHAVRSPWYALQLVGWSPRGAHRLLSGLYEWGRAEEIKARAAAAADGDFLRIWKLARLRTEIAVAIGGAACTAAGTGLLLPDTRLATAAALVAVCGGAGKPIDRPAVPSAVVASPTYRRITPDIIMRALHAAKLCKETDGPDAPQFVSPVTRDGPGWGAVIDLPFGFTAAQAIDRRTEIAAGLRVDEFRLFLDRDRTSGGHAGRIKLWVANEDPYAQPPVVTPLAKADRWDLWREVPFGVDERGRTVSFLLVWTSVLIGAIPRMGKTFSARLLAAAAALDPHVRLLVFDGKGGKDWDPFEQVAHRFGAGPDDEVCEHLRDVLRETKEDMNRRYKTLRKLPTNRCPEGKLTPALARDRSLNMPLTVIAIDEFQRYLENPKFGAEIYGLLLELAKVAPAVGIILLLATQRPSSKTMPTELRDNIGTRFALRVTTREFSEMILGTGSYRAGLDASKFLASHKGVGILLGADDGKLTDKGGQTVRTHLLDLPALVKLTAKARRLREGEGTLTGVAAGEAAKVLSDHLLEHVVAAFRGREKAQSWWLLRNMAEDYPNLYPPDEWEPADLAAALGRFEISGGNQVWGECEDGSKGNRKGFHLADVMDALLAREGDIPDAPPDDL